MTRTRQPAIASALAAMIVGLFPGHGAAAGVPVEPQQQAGEPPDEPQTNRGGPGESLKRLSIEQLGRIEVVSVSRHSESATDAATAITVITGDVLRRAGVTTLPDALRLAFGVAVGRDGNSWAISARGFNAPTANKMVVLLDGRSVYTPLFSGVIWDQQDVILADVDRIEVIRGAGGALWGANAMNGVINIITKLATDTQGGLAQIGGGPDLGVAALRYGGTVGNEGHYRVYGKFRNFGSLPYATGEDPHTPLRAGQTGFRVDVAPKSATSLTVQGDAYVGRFDLVNSTPGDMSGANLLGRLRHTSSSGGQLQVQAYYDMTYRRVPVQYAERRHTLDGELQYRVPAGTRHDLVVGAGLSVTHDHVTPTATFFFVPLGRTSPLLNVFAQDEITLVPSRLALILGAKIEHNDYTGLEHQPSVRLRWKPARNQTFWGAMSRAVRMPARFDSDLRFTAGLPIVVLQGSETFQSERALEYEIGYRSQVVPRLSFGMSAFANSYDRLRSEEPTPPLGVPVKLANNYAGQTGGVELGAHLELASTWQIWGGYSWLHERFAFDPSSHDTTGGSLEHNDPAHQIWLRSFSNLPGRWELDATVRHVGALPKPAVPGYSEATLRLARPLGRNVECELIGDNLLHHQHIEFINLGPVHAVPRSVFARLTWRSR